VSRIGKNPIIVPNDVDIKYDNKNIEVSGPKGKLNLNLRPEIKLEKKDDLLLVNLNEEIKEHEAMRGLYRVLIYNMFIGVTKGYIKKLEVIGTGYKVNVEGNMVILNVGFSNPINYNIPEGIKISVEEGTNLTIEGIDKQLVGEVAATIRKIRPPEPYKGKGIKYADEIIRRKTGKTT
jgi:large subunit ribosomal protein L6